jgi:hypothetical protein
VDVDGAGVPEADGGLLVGALTPLPSNRLVRSSGAVTTALVGASGG